MELQGHIIFMAQLNLYPPPTVSTSRKFSGVSSSIIHHTAANPRLFRGVETVSGRSDMIISRLFNPVSNGWTTATCSQSVADASVLFVGPAV
jgi:hypothetical protein